MWLTVNTLLSSHAVISDPWEEGNVQIPGFLSENDPPAASLFSFVFVELSAGVDLGIHSIGQTLNANQGLLAKVCPAACVQPNPPVLPVWQTCPQVNQMGNKSKSSAQAGLGKPNKGQWVCADCCISGINAWTWNRSSKSSFWLLPEKVQKALKLGQKSQSWNFSVTLQMIWSLSQENTSCSMPCPDRTFISSLALLFQLCKSEEVQGTPEQEGQTFSNFHSNCTAKGVCAQQEARPPAQRWGPGEGSLLQSAPDSPVAPGGVPWDTGQTLEELCTFQLPALWWELHTSYTPVEYPVVIHVPLADLKKKPSELTDYGEYRKGPLECASCGCSTPEI